MRANASAALLAATILSLAGCDALLVDPAPPEGTDAVIALDLGPSFAFFAAESDSLFGVRELRLRFLQDGGARDTVLIAKLGPRLEARVGLHADEVREGLKIRAELIVRDDLPWASGTGVLVDVGIAPVARIDMVRDTLVAALLDGLFAIALSRLDGSDRTVIEGLSTTDLDWYPSADGPLLWPGGLQGSAYRTHIGDPYTGAGWGIPLPGNMRARWPSFSPDGEVVYFTDSGTSGGSPIMRVRPDGSDLQVVLQSGPAVGSHLTHARPSHDGGRLVYTRDDLNDEAELHVLRIGSPFGTPLGIPGTAGVWSPNDEWIAYVPVPRPSGLRIVRPDGSGDRELVADPVHGLFDWTADGRSIVAVSAVDNTAFIVDVSTGVLQPLPALGEVFGVKVIP